MTDVQKKPFSHRRRGMEHRIILKRVRFQQFRINAQDDDEAYAMRDAAEHVRKALVAGYVHARQPMVASLRIDRGAQRVRAMGGRSNPAP
jgi:hypothetical protein